MDILEELSQTSISLLLREPFYAHMLSGINKVVVGPGHPVDSLAVSRSGKGFTLYINASFWNNELKNPDHRYGVLKHELLHLVFRHLMVDEPRLDRMMMNIAFDLVVNQYVETHQLPEESLFLDTFPDLGLLPDQTWFYYYKKLEELKQKEDGAQPDTPGQERLNRIRSDSHGMDRHQPWQTRDTQTELEKNLADSQLESILRSAQQRSSAQAWGSLPSFIREHLHSELATVSRKVNWRRVLRLFVGSSGKTYLRTTLKRPSKRYGTNPGQVVRHRQRLIVAIDTSGSIGKHELNLFFGELFFLWRTGVQIEVLECDTTIHHQYPYKGKTPETATGRGGTNFSEPIKRANTEMPDALIYFTDGFAPQPSVQPRVPMLWLLTAGGLQDDNPMYQALPGRKVRFANV